MSALAILIPLSVVLVAGAFFAFRWSVLNRQFDNLDREGKRILFDDDDVRRK